MKFNKIALLILLLASCGCTEWIPLEKETSDWLTDLDEDHIFEMVDENNITQSWKLNVKNNYFSEGSSGILFVTTSRSYREMSYEKFQNDVLGQFAISVEADYSVGNDYLSFSTDRMSVDFTVNDLEIKRLTVDYPSNESVHWSYQFDEPLTSKPVIVDNQELAGTTYGETLIFRLEDYQNVLGENDIIAFYFAKEEGLIYLELKSGLKYYRK